MSATATASSKVNVLSICAEQDQALEELEETVTSTKHITLLINNEIGLHTRLIVCIIQSIIYIASIDS